MITYVFQKYPENFAFELSIILQFLLSFMFTNKNLRINNLKTRAAINVKIPVVLIWVEPIIIYFA